MEDLQTESAETVNLGVPAPDAVIYIDVVERPHGLRMSTEVGRREPYHATALGKAIAAHWPEFETQLEALLAHGPLAKKTPRTIVDPLTLRRELEATRARGYAIDDEESESGVRCVGAPVFDHRGAVIAAISLAGPASRLPASRIAALGPKVVAAARRISAGMGFSPA
jgi:IclR family acetate operon transcriptional repressor